MYMGVIGMSQLKSELSIKCKTTSVKCSTNEYMFN